jgi:C4-dicarboxylate transporter, DctM subunit
MANRFLGLARRGEILLADLSLLLLALFPFLDIVAREFFRTDVRYSNLYLVHLVLLATFLAGAVTSRLKKHLSLAVEIPIAEPYKSAIHAFVRVLCAAIAIAFSWSSLSFILLGFENENRIGIFPTRLVLLVMVFGYLVMGVRFVFGREHGDRRWLWLFLAVLLGSLIASSSIARIFADGPSAPLADLLDKLQAPLQTLIARAALPVIILLILSAFLGAPIFIVLGGIGYFLFAGQALPVEEMPHQAYAMLTGFSIASIPLFAITGFILSESRASQRLIRLFLALFSWFPGGLAIVAILICAFFTTFTGASGVTILALGGLLSYILIHGGYGRRFTIGLLTAAGSIGLLFPPSLPVIIYGVTAQISINEMFIGGLLPGLVLVLAMISMGIVYAIRKGVERHPFQFREALVSFRESIWDVLLPLIIFAGYFGVGVPIVKRFAIGVIYLLIIEALTGRDRGSGKFQVLLLTYVPISAAFFVLFLSSGPSWLAIGMAAMGALFYGLQAGHLSDGSRLGAGDSALLGKFLALAASLLAMLAIAASMTLTLVESAAIATIYSLIVQVVVHRDLKLSQLTQVMAKCLPIIGGVLTILALANGLSYYIIDANIPVKLTAWVQAVVASKYLFLLLLNLVMLVVGCFLDIYSAILIVAPLVIPLGELFGIHPVHLGIIFLANLELGYLTPPVGMNLYLSSYCFNEPVVRVAKDTFKFLLIQLATVLMITYLPFLTTFLLKK